MFTGNESITIMGNTLVRNFDKTMDLLEEILLEPRWDEDELKRIKISTINGIMRSAANPNAVANKVYNKLLYGEKHMFSHPTSGTEESVEAITMDDLKEYYNKYFIHTITL